MAQLTYDSGRFVWLGGYEDRHVPKAAGFFFGSKQDPDFKRWWTKRPEVAVHLQEYADASARKVLQAHVAALEASRALDAPDVSVPLPGGVEFMPFQKAGVKYLLDAHAAGHKGVLLADEMGLGKTVQVLGFFNGAKPRRMLVVCPASLKENWRREALKWTWGRPTVEVWSTKQQRDADIVIVNYDIVWRKPVAQALEKYHPHTMVWDECHYLKNMDAKRTKGVFGLDAKFVVALTGTPIPNRPIEMFPILNNLRPDIFGHRVKYGYRYCDGQVKYFYVKGGKGKQRAAYDFTGASRLDELQNILRTNLMIRRLKSEVLKDLPPKIRQVIPLDVPEDAMHLVAEQRRAWDEVVGTLGYDRAVAQLMSGGGIEFATVSRLRQELAEAKVAQVAEYAEGMLEGGVEKLVIFGHHHVMLDGLKAALKKYGLVMLDGRTPLTDRQALVDKFQTDTNCRVFLGGIQAAGVGLTLTAASHCLLAELPWRPADVTQAEDRLHRIGQDRGTLVQHLVFDGSLDADMAQLILEKQQVADAALDKREDTAPVQARIADAAKKAEEEKERSRSTPRPSITYDQKVAVLLALRNLALVCDGARELDDMGFNGVDSAFGRSLAMQSSLSDRQAMAGLKMLRKYRRQIPEPLYARMFGGSTQ